MQQTVGEPTTNCPATISDGPLQKDVPELADPQEQTDNSSSQIRDVVWKTY